MTEFLPFQYCDDKEFFDLLPVIKSKLKSKISCSTIAQILPYYPSTDFEMLRECLTNKDQFLEFLENNNFTSVYNNITDGLSPENFSCKYYNEDKFNSIIPKQPKISLKAFHLNIRSLNLNCHQLKAFLSCLNCEFDIILLTEIGKPDKQIIEEVFENYTLYSDPPKSKKGGAGILIKNDCYDEIEISENKVNLDCQCTNCIVESIFINIKSNNDVHTVGSVYRHPSGNVTHFNDSLDQCLKKFNSNNMFLLAGDINIDLLKTNLQSTQDYLNTMLSYNLIPSIIIPTRVTDRSSTLIDHIFVRLPKSKISNQITSGNFISDITDHFSNFIIVDIELKKTMERPLIRLFTKKNTEKFKQNLSAEFADINEHINLQDNPNVNEIYKILYEKLISLLDLYFPKVRLSRKKAKDKNWITIGIKNAIKHRNQLYKIKIKEDQKAKT